MSASRIVELSFLKDMLSGPWFVIVVFRVS